MSKFYSVIYTLKSQMHTVTFLIDFEKETAMVFDGYTHERTFFPPEIIKNGKKAAFKFEGDHNRKITFIKSIFDSWIREKNAFVYGVYELNELNGKKTAKSCKNFYN